MTDRRLRPPRHRDTVGAPAAIDGFSAFLLAKPGGARDRELVWG